MQNRLFSKFIMGVLAILWLLSSISEGHAIRQAAAPLFNDVVVVGDKAYISYFTHPRWETHFAATLDADGKYPYAEKRSSIQVAELVVRDGLPVVKDSMILLIFICRI